MLRLRRSALRAFWLVPIAILAGCGAAVHAQRSAVEHSFVALRSECGTPGPLSYHWPVKPFGLQHRVRGGFGDPRSVFRDPSVEDVGRGDGSFSFHNGVDIVAKDGSTVYPVVSGRAETRDRGVYGNEVIVRTADGRSFQYFHVVPAIRDGQWVTVGQTVLGHVERHRHHVHLAEIDRGHVVNPLSPGHLDPYRDTRPPGVRGLELENSAGRKLDAAHVHGVVDIAANVFDRTSLPGRGVWARAVLAPALVSWRLTSSSGKTVVPETVVADFRHTLPPEREFWHVYDAGTYQNFPAIGRHYFFGRPGRFLFNLTRRPLDTRLLASGTYEVTVEAADICGNRAVFTEPIRVSSRGQAS